jgi:hypothetical protein
MRMLTRRLQVLLDEDRYQRLERHASLRGASVAALVREAIDIAFPEAELDRWSAGELPLSAEPMDVWDWPAMKARMLDEMAGVGPVEDRCSPQVEQEPDADADRKRDR